MSVDHLMSFFCNEKSSWVAMLPGLIKEDRLIDGKRDQVGGRTQMVYHDGGIIETRTEKIDRVNGYFAFAFASKNVPGYKDLGTVLEEFIFKPITFNGCPFTQAIVDKEAQKKDMPFFTEKTLVEWRTTSSKELNIDLIKQLRSLKIDHFSEMIKDITSMELIAKMRSVQNEDDFYLRLKQVMSGSKNLEELGKTMKPGLTFDHALKQAELLEKEYDTSHILSG